jgi:hypothetical protein
MRLVILIILSQLSVKAIGQRIDFRNDSLFVDTYYVDGFTTKSTLDSLLKTNGSQSKAKGHYKPGTTEIMNWKIYTYRTKGLIFRKNDADRTQLLLSVKLNRNSNAVVDQSNMPTRPFKGELFIAGNYLNDKTKVEQLQALKNCAMNYDNFAVATIVCQQRQIMVLFDVITGEVTCIFIN